MVKDVAVGLRLGLHDARRVVEEAGTVVIRPTAADVTWIELPGMAPIRRIDLARIMEARLREMFELAGREVASASPESILGGVILSGGNIDPRFLANVILRNLARTGRIGRIAVVLQDKVGSLHEISGIFTRNGANILEVSHQRIFGVLSAKSTQTEIEYEIRDVASFEQLKLELDDAGYVYELLTISGRKPGRNRRPG